MRRAVGPEFISPNDRRLAQCMARALPHSRSQFSEFEKAREAASAALADRANKAFASSSPDRRDSRASEKRSTERISNPMPSPAESPRDFAAFAKALSRFESGPHRTSAPQTFSSSCRNADGNDLSLGSASNNAMRENCPLSIPTPPLLAPIAENRYAPKTKDGKARFIRPTDSAPPHGG